MAVQFTSSGSNQAINFNSPTHLDNLDPLTVCAWINPTNWGESSFGRIACKEGSSTGWLFFLDDSTNIDTLGFLRYRSTTDADRRAVDSSLSLNEWTHVAATYTTTSGNLFINGVQVSLQTDTAGSGSHVSDASSNFFVGDRPSFSRGFNGRIENIQVYERVLSEAEIHYIYQTRGYGALGDAVLNAPMDEGIVGGSMGTGDFLKDHSINSETGHAILETMTWAEGIRRARRKVG